MSRCWQDLRYAARVLAKTPVVTAVASAGFGTFLAWAAVRYFQITPCQRTEGTETGGDHVVRLPAGVVLKPPVSVEDLKTDIEHDPEGAEEFVALIRALRKESSRPDALHNAGSCGYRCR